MIRGNRVQLRYVRPFPCISPDCVPYQNVVSRISGSLSHSPPGRLSPVEIGAQNVWRVTCNNYICARPVPVFLLPVSLTQKWLPLDPVVLVIFSKPRKDAAMARNANSLMTSSQHLERE